MKKLLLSLITLTVALPAFAQNLPFVGKRTFSFGTDGSESTIAIAKNGKTTITRHHLGDSQTVYQGKYHSYLPIAIHGTSKSYYQIKGDKIHWLNHQKQLMIGCFAYKSSLDNNNEACITQLETAKP